MQLTLLLLSFLVSSVNAASMTKPDGGPGPSAEELAKAITSELDYDNEESGCKDGTTEGRFRISCHVQACAGRWSGDISGASSQLCAKGWHVCSPATDGGSVDDRLLLKTITFTEAQKPSGCFAYNAANDFGQCRHLNCDENSFNDMGSIGSTCNLKPTATSCLGTGRIDLKGRACGSFKAGETTGVLCCKDLASINSGCKDGTAEAIFSSTKLVRGCAGKWAGSLAAGGSQLCAPGWDTCSPVEVDRDAELLKKISFSEASGPKGCFPYNASNDFGQCRPLDCSAGNYNDLGAVGSSCNLKPTAGSCLGSGRIDLKGKACSEFVKGVTTGLLCCKG
eukprot:m.308428 g.308428  ORF g.308428 m.308428 type:complete len:337 (+) comp43981_c0_seq1:546-1556(+)